MLHAELGATNGLQLASSRSLPPRRQGLTTTSSASTSPMSPSTAAARRAQLRRREPARTRPIARRSDGNHTLRLAQRRITDAVIPKKRKGGEANVKKGAYHGAALACRKYKRMAHSGRLSYGATLTARSLAASRGSHWPSRSCPPAKPIKWRNRWSQGSSPICWRLSLRRAGNTLPRYRHCSMSSCLSCSILISSVKNHRSGDNRTLRARRSTGRRGTA
jgi:hypothetical protein